MFGWNTEEPEDEQRAGTYSKGLTWLALSADQPEGDTEAGTTDFVASTGTVDRMGDVIDQGSWKVANYRRNPVILYEHSYPVVGISTKVGIHTGPENTKSLRNRVKWDDSEVNPVGMLVAHQHRNKFRRAVSVGFAPAEAKSRTELPPDHPAYVDGEKTARWKAGYLFRQNELLEISTVGVPANQEALQLALDAYRAENMDAAIGKYLGDSLDRRTAATVLAAFKSSPEIRRQVKALIYSEGTLATPPNPHNNVAAIQWLPEHK